MDFYNKEMGIKILLGLSLITCIFNILIKGIENINLILLFNSLTTAISIDMTILWLFKKWFWKLKIFKGWLVYFENLNGTWLGNLTTKYTNNETKEECEVIIPVMLTVKQEFDTVSCRVITKAMNSHSFSSTFYIDKSNQKNQLIYLYHCNPDILKIEDNRPHEGTVILDVYTKPTKKLVGKYWTDRKSVGELNLEFCTKELLETLPSNINIHPLFDKQ